MGTRVGLIFFFNALVPLNFLRLQNLIAHRPSGKAIDYSLGRWPALTRYIDDGDLGALHTGLVHLEYHSLRQHHDLMDGSRIFL